MNTSTSDPRIPASEKCVLHNLLEYRATERGSKTFAIFEDDTKWSYARTLEIVRETAAGLAELGVKRGDHVLVWLPNGKDILRTWFAINYLGAVYVPINLAYKGGILEHVVRLSDARVLVGHGDLLDRLEGIDTASLTTVITLKGKQTVLTGLKMLGEDALRGDPATLDEVERDVAPWDLQCIMLTSGTTGLSKGVMSTYFQLFAVVDQPFQQLSEDDRFLVNLPLFHVGGTVAVYAMLVRGGSIAVVESFNVKTFWYDVNRLGVTVATILGSMTPLLYSAPETDADASSPLRVAFMVPLVVEPSLFSDRFGCEVYTLYNMTEISSPIVSGPSPTPLGTCGKLRSGIDARIVDRNDYEVAVGDVGELILRSEMPWEFTTGYYKDGDATAQAWRNGWFHTGDAFRMDEQGNFYFMDRQKDAIRRRGENISSFEVEAEVSAHPNVKETAVIAARDSIGEEEVMAVMILNDPAAFDPIEMIAFFVSRLPHFMVPRYLLVVEDLPRTPTQKVQKKALRDQNLMPRAWDRDAGGIKVKRQKLNS